MLGLHLDSSKTHWTFTDGTKPDLKFLAKHTTGGKLPVDKAKPHVVYGANTLRKMLPTTTDVNMAGFVCESQIVEEHLAVMHCSVDTFSLLACYLNRRILRRPDIGWYRRRAQI